jgi:thiosulfate reductase cytochrome b subunit
VDRISLALPLLFLSLLGIGGSASIDVLRVLAGGWFIYRTAHPEARVP